jgi:methylthioribose-1-phosphate isomerase
MELIQPVAWSADERGVRILDQRQLPGREVYRDLRTIDDVCDAIRTLAVRGAPAIGVARRVRRRSISRGRSTEC